jgi:hypothetical protein
MSPLDAFYEDNLYPLQNGVLRIVEKLGSPFYLTGGTALSRGYYHHRYSDDLDLFVNRHDEFALAASRIVRAVTGSYRTEVENNTADFIRLNVSKEPVELRVDLVNDSSGHVGEFLSVANLGRVDSILNILANKLTALYRYEAKDVADIIEICRHEAFSWPDMIENAIAKEAGIDPASIAEILVSVPEVELTKVRWINRPDFEKLRRRLSVIAEDVLSGRANDPSRLG